MSVVWQSAAAQRSHFRIASNNGWEIVSRVWWLALVIVCAAHIILISGFSLTITPLGETFEQRDYSTLRLVETPPVVPILPKKHQTAPMALASPSQASPTQIQADAVRDKEMALKRSGEAEQPASLLLPYFNPQRFINVEDLDVPAVGTSVLEDMLSNVLPARFGFVVLELLIDETGRTVQVACIEGECSEILNEKLQALLAAPFIPALRGGHAVASRKVIHVLPVPTNGL